MSCRGGVCGRRFFILVDEPREGDALKGHEYSELLK